MSEIKDSVVNVAHFLQKSLTEASFDAQEIEKQRMIRILLHLRSADNELIRTFSLFEEGFYSNWIATDHLSSTDRNLMVLSHLVFTILKRWNIKLNLKDAPTSGRFYSSLSAIQSGRTILPTCMISNPPPGIHLLTGHHSTLNFATTLPSVQPVQKINSSVPKKRMECGIPALSYSQVLNLPKQLDSMPMINPSVVEEMSYIKGGTFPPMLCIFRFDDRRQGRYNSPCTFLGEVHVRISLAAHTQFLYELVKFCNTPKEITKRINKVNLY